jgi:hypothetical protein
MGISERIAKLEGARQAARGGSWPPVVVQLMGQSDEEAWCLSEHRNRPLADCQVIGEEIFREVGLEDWGQMICPRTGKLQAEVRHDKLIADVRAEQEAVRALIEEEANGN